MSDEEKPKKPGNEPNPDRFQPKPYLIWFIILTAIILLLMFNPNPPPQGVELSSTRQVLQLAKDGKIVSLKLKENASGGYQYYDIWGEMKNPEAATAPPSEASGEPGEAASPPPATVPFSASGRITDGLYEELTSQIPPDKIDEPKASNMLVEVLVGLLPFLLIIGLLYFLFVRQLRMAGKGAMSFGKSKAKMLTRDKELATFKDVAGTGKTLLAKAIAGEADVPFFTISGSDFVEMFVGVGAARVRDMFEQGRRHAPCLIFIDEIDAVGRQRFAGLGGGNDEREQTLNSLLVEMDGFDTQEGIIIIAATNRPDVLDQALLRPGRFDRQIGIEMPDLNGREQILKVHTKKIKMRRDVDLRRIARSTVGFSGADLANLVNEAALLAARYDKPEVTSMEFEEARDKIAFGRERRKLMDDEDKRMTAFHEAGHALVKALIKDKKLELHKVTIIPRGQALGLTMSTPTKDILGMSRNELLNLICVSMAGRIGEEIETGDFSNGAMGDIRGATRIARQMVCDFGMSELGPVAYGENQGHIFLAREITRQQDYSEETAKQIDAEIRRIIDEQYRRAEAYIREHVDALRKTAEALLQYETIEGKHVQEIIEHGEIRSPVLNNAPSLDTDTNTEPSRPSAAAQPEEPQDLGPETEPAGAPA